jgi:Na+/H+ antiporter NhaD/arsenite permease-like protein
MDKSAIAVVVFLVAYAFIISEKIHRTIVAMAGAILVILLGVLDQAAAIHHIDFNTLGLLVGMMVIVTVTAETGIFTYLAIWSAKRAGADPGKLLILLSLITAVASALLDNVTTVLLVVPVTISIMRQLQTDPIPVLIAEIIASNIGGTATLIGDPPNIMIGSAVKELTFMSFVNNLAAISLSILVITITILYFIYRNKLTTDETLKANVLAMNEREAITDAGLLKKSLLVLALTLGGFFTHQIFHLESATVALAGAFLLLLITIKDHHDLDRILGKVEWNTIFFFIGLFVLVGGLIETGLIAALAEKAVQFTGGDVKTSSLLILWMSAIASAFIDNIPFVATMIPMIQDMGSLGIQNLEPLWWSLALGACLGGNGSLIGASANIIVAGLALQAGYRISFARFLLIGFPMMLLSLVIATVYVYFRYLV